MIRLALLKPLFAVSLLVASCVVASQEAKVDTSTKQVSGQGHFVAHIVKRPEPIKISQIHSWVLQVSDSSGNPVENAKITIDGGMPRHDHGLPTAPRVTGYLGQGQYLVEGMKFQMTGHWQVIFHIEASRQQDQVTFNIVL